jgi:hypothetical protein
MEFVASSSCLKAPHTGYDCVFMDIVFFHSWSNKQLKLKTVLNCLDGLVDLVEDRVFVTQDVCLRGSKRQGIIYRGSGFKEKSMQPVSKLAHLELKKGTQQTRVQRRIHVTQEVHRDHTTTI